MWKSIQNKRFFSREALRDSDRLQVNDIVCLSRAI